LKYFGILEKVSLIIYLIIFLSEINIDQTRPLNFSQSKRNCHIKFMSIDDQVAIMGNGNMDSQSWFHSQVKYY
jgi:phosphatidylserine/phosphatidylglycerophosphate/cardiolipin synthase-like enzyme